MGVKVTTRKVKVLGTTEFIRKDTGEQKRFRSFQWKNATSTFISSGLVTS